jgi:hypothetical protein
MATQLVHGLSPFPLFFCSSIFEFPVRLKKGGGDPLDPKSKEYEAIAATDELLCNLLAGKPCTQWVCIVQKLYKHDSWVGADGKKHKRKCPRGYVTFLDCLELHKLTVFSADTAKRQQYCIQQGIQKPQWATVSLFPMWKY